MRMPSNLMRQLSGLNPAVAVAAPYGEVSEVKGRKNPTTPGIVSTD
jgi:hypothetical protein